MKEIIVAIDFSKGSVHALKYAITIANTVEANIQMVWVYKPESVDTVYSKTEDFTKEEVKKRFDEIVKKYSKCLKGKLEYKIRKGKVYQEIVNQAKYSDAYMIVAGTHGASGFEEFWIGSNAYKIVTSASCPVITVRENFKLKDSFTKIVLPIDSTLESRQKVPFASQLAKSFGAEIHLLAVYSTSIKSIHKLVDSYVKQVEDYLENNKVKFVKHSLEADNVTNTTIEYAKTIDADLIAIMTEQETSAANIWLGTYAQQMVNHSQFPVLSIHPKEVNLRTQM